MIIDGKVMLTTAEAAVRLGVTAGRVRHFVLARRIKYIKYGRDILIPETELAKLADRRPGRPQARKRKPARRPTGPRNTLRLPIRQDL